MDSSEAADSAFQAPSSPESAPAPASEPATATSVLPATAAEPADAAEPDEPAAPLAPASPAGPVGSAPVETRSASRWRTGSPRTALRWLTGLWAALLVGASLLWPVSYGYDELQHFDMAYQYSHHPTTFYAPGALRMSKAAVAIAALEPPNPKIGPFATAPIAARGDRPTLQGLGGVAIAPGSPINQMVQHPPLYYELGAVVLRLPGVSHLAWDQQFWLVRLLSVLLMLPVPLLCFGAARRLARRMLPNTAAPAVAPAEGASPGTAATLSRFSGRQNAIGLIAATIPLTVPNLIRDGSAVTNDSLLISATSFFLYFLIRICLGEVSKKIVAGASIAVTVALLTKGFALVLPPLLFIGLIIGWRQKPGEGETVRDRRQLAWVSGIFLVSMIVGALWWLRNLIRFSTVQVNGFGPGATQNRYGSPDNNGSFIKFFPDFFNQVIERFWGGFALPDYPLGSSISVWGWPVVLCIGLLVALTVRRHRAITLLLLLSVLFTFGVLIQNSWSLYSTHSKIGVQAAQGRYLYHLIVALAAVAAVGWAAVLRPRITNVVAYGVLLLGLVTNASAWFMILDTWYSGGPVHLSLKLRNAVHGLFRWSPVPKPLTAAVFVVVAVTAVLCCLQIRRYCRSLQAAERALTE
ncbi:MAG: Small subunit ribosomal protein [Frankiales bacterium]|nr:Small subunit ribosomal protein [Frankiales bacterium]